VEAGGRLPLDERGYPVDDRCEEHGDRPEEDEDEVRDRKDQAEEDRQPVALEIVLDDELDGMLNVHAALMTY
jgi:hypothetical protein